MRVLRQAAQTYTPNAEANFRKPCADACRGCFDVCGHIPNVILVLRQRVHHDSGRSCFREVAKTMEALFLHSKVDKVMSVEMSRSAHQIRARQLNKRVAVSFAIQSDARNDVVATVAPSSVGQTDGRALNCISNLPFQAVASMRAPTTALSSTKTPDLCSGASSKRRVSSNTVKLS